MHAFITHSQPTGVKQLAALIVGMPRRTNVDHGSASSAVYFLKAFKQGHAGFAGVSGVCLCVETCCSCAWRLNFFASCGFRVKAMSNRSTYVRTSSHELASSALTCIATLILLIVSAYTCASLQQSELLCDAWIDRLRTSEHDCLSRPWLQLTHCAMSFPVVRRFNCT